ncbi:hypothetical protein ASD76_14410 [Altererythrobacter sp. Root672]|nr:hypothetical protein ASD76_14410 [Altererythrobacter sp. Root672]
MATRKRSRWAAIAAAGVLVCAGLPTAGLALGALDNDARLVTGGSFVTLTPASVDPQLAAFVAKHTDGGARLMRFTPAGVAERSSRSVTVAVRVNADEARAISVRGAIAAALDQVASDAGARIAPTRYNLGISRGYQNFAKPEPSPARISNTLSDASIPDLVEIKPATEKVEQSRFAPRVEMEQQAKTGSTPRTIDSRADQMVDIGAGYRVTRNLDVTAGVRYSQERDRLAPVAAAPAKDNQAVYVGTQFRF